MKNIRRHSGSLNERGLFSRERRERGASIIIAFVFMLICVCICAIVLGFASTGSITAKHKKDNEHTYYALSSALESTSEMFDETGPLHSMFMTDVASSPTAPSRVAFPDASSEPSSGTLPDAVYRWLAEAVGTDGSNMSKTFDVNVTTDAVSIPRVKITYSLKNDYTIVLTATPDIDASSSGYQVLQMEIPRKVTATSGLYGSTYSWTQGAS